MPGGLFLMLPTGSGFSPVEAHPVGETRKDGFRRLEPVLDAFQAVREAFELPRTVSVRRRRMFERRSRPESPGRPGSANLLGRPWGVFLSGLTEGGFLAVEGASRPGRRMDGFRWLAAVPDVFLAVREVLRWQRETTPTGFGVAPRSRVCRRIPRKGSPAEGCTSIPSLPQ